MTENVPSTEQIPPVDEPSKQVTRRSILVAGTLLVGAGIGVGAGFIATAGQRNPFDRTVSLPEPPAQLISAQARESELIATLTAVLANSPSDPRAAFVLADHRAHLNALTEALRQYRESNPTAATGSGFTVDPAPHSVTVTGVSAVAELVTAETAARVAAATESASLSGDLAALLASISACEASHVELLR